LARRLQHSRDDDPTDGFPVVDRFASRGGECATSTAREHAPYANYSYSPAGGNTTTLFRFWAKVFDQEDPVTALEVHWDWESDGTWDTPWSTEKNATHTFDSPGT